MPCSPCGSDADYDAASREEHWIVAGLLGKAGHLRTLPIPARIKAVIDEWKNAAGIEKLAPHDLRWNCARLCHLAGRELDQIQFLLGHVSIQTTERST